MKKIQKAALSVIVTAMAIVIAMSCSEEMPVKPHNRGINVIPTPMEMILTDTVATFRLHEDVKIGAQSAILEESAHYLSGILKPATGFNLKVAQRGDIEFSLNPNYVMGEEGYAIKVTATKVSIEVSTTRGAFNAIQTLMQLLPAEIESRTVIEDVSWNIPLVEIHDKPRFGYRGLMLDAVRHFIPVESVKRQLDMMAKYKFNTLHWHLTDDQGWRVEIEKYPELTQKGATRTEGDGSTYGPYYYTSSQIREIVDYAAARHIEVIPEIEMPGHVMGLLSSHPEFSCRGGELAPRIIWGVEQTVLCVGNEEAVDFVKNVLTEIASLFPSKYIHIGGDECPTTEWESCPKCQDLARRLRYSSYATTNTKAGATTTHSGYQLQAHFIRQIEQHLSSLNKKMIGWDEVYNDRLPKNATIMCWRDREYGLEAAEQGYNVIFTPMYDGMYLNFYQGRSEVEPVTIGGYYTLDSVYNFNIDLSDLPASKRKNVLGVQANMWTEYAHTPQEIEYMLYPRLLALSEVAWSPVDRKDFSDFKRRINNAYVRMDLSGIGYYVPQPEGLLERNYVYYGKESDSIKFSNTLGYPMVYTLDGSEPTANSPIVSDSVVAVSGAGVLKIATITPVGGLSKVRSVPFGRAEKLAPAVDSAAVIEAVGLQLPYAKRDRLGVIAREAMGYFVDNRAIEQATLGMPRHYDFFMEGKWHDTNLPFIIVYEGFVDLPEDGVYGFATDMQQLWLDGELLISNERLSRHNSNKMMKAMAAGKHRFRLVFNNQIKDGWPGSWSVIDFSYKLPSSDEYIRVTPEMLSF